jgi:hypothetical protein
MQFVFVTAVIAAIVWPLSGVAGAGRGAAFVRVSAPPETSTLAGLRDRARPLLIFGPEPGDSRMQAQLSILRDNAAEAADRDLVAIALPATGVPPTETRLTADDAAAARRRFHVKAGEFVVILVGKDGGEKLRSDKPIAFERLRSVVDAMPMRKEEMKGKERGFV